MGVPYLFKTLSTNYPDTLENATATPTARLFLDFNCAIHFCNNNTDLQYTGDDIAYEKQLITETIKYLDFIIQFNNPTDLVYISIDGVPPRAKMVQQRQRRYINTWRKTKINEYNASIGESPVDTWDTNAISPGTVFMQKLSQEITKYISFKKSKPQMLLSNDTEKGEGEFKIFKYIAATRDIGDSCDVIYGLDGDLIFLGLIHLQPHTGTSSIKLLREPVFFEKNDCKLPFIYLNLQTLKEQLLVNLRPSMSVADDDGDDHFIILNFVVLCFLLGNDFIPHLSFISIKENGIAILLEMYSCVKKKLHSDVINKTTGMINFQFLLELIKLLSVMEDTQFPITDELYYKRSIRFDTSDFNKMIDVYPIVNKYPNCILPMKSKWRQRYYFHLFSTCDGENINSICQNYFESIQWTYDYYIKQTYHKTWYYRYPYSPTIIDLYNYLLTSGKANITEQFRINEIFYPDIDIDEKLQLVMILPRYSHKLFPNELKHICEDLNPFLHLYPFTCKLHVYLKFYLWQCVPMLPDIDLIKLHEYVCSVYKLKRI
jgi:5'-3' exonuclease